jgi:hypothetical protein
MTPAPVDGDVRMRSPSVATVAKPPTVMPPGTPRLPSGRAFHAETLPWMSVARARKA